MAYARRRTTRRQPARRSTGYRSAPKRTYARRAPARRVRRASARKSPQTVRVVIQTAPAPSLSAPTPDMVQKAKVARF